MSAKAVWSGSQMDAFLEQSRVPVRLACNGGSGHPVLASLWYLPDEGKLWCATQQSASVTTLLARDPRCAFEVSVEAPPYCGIRGRAFATLHDDRGEEILRRLIRRYLGDSRPGLARRLLARVGSETAISIEPQTRVSWDYTERMEQAV
jgi:hypothetical protein